MPGVIARNPHEGTRSEYLAQYVFSAFGTSVPVPHPEDTGIDLYCTLCEEIGSRFVVKNYYLVQVKSNNEPIEYNGEETVKWLFSHNYPFFICVINKKEHKFELYQTLALAILGQKTNIKKVTLIPQDKENFNFFPTYIENSEIELFLGKPIVSLSIFEIENKETRNKIKLTLKSWIEVDQENINLKGTGCYRVPESWETNKPIQPLKIVGNFKDLLINPDAKQRFDDLFFRLLSQLVNQLAAERNIEKYNILLNFIINFLKRHSWTDSYGIRILQFCVNSANKYLGIPGQLNILKNKKIIV